MQKSRIERVLRWLFFLAVVAVAAGCGSSGSDLPAASGGSAEAIPTTPVFSDYRFSEPQVTGDAFYIDPIHGSDGGDGSADRPWRTLQRVIEDGLIECYRRVEAYDPDSDLTVVKPGAPVKGGDRLLLRSGYHGHVDLQAVIFTDWLTIAGQDGHTPVLSQFKLMGAVEKIYLKNFTILKDSYDGPGDFWEADAINHNTDACLYLGSNSFWGVGRQVKVNGLTVKTTDDASAWTADDWVQKSAAVRCRTIPDAIGDGYQRQRHVRDVADPSVWLADRPGGPSAGNLWVEIRFMVVPLHELAKRASDADRQGPGARPSLISASTTTDAGSYPR